MEAKGSRLAQVKGAGLKRNKSVLLLNNNAMVEMQCAFKFKTKIICTLGPSSRSIETLKNLLKAGMNVARFNFSHGSHEYHQETLDNLRTASKQTNIYCAVLLDTKGPEIRTGMLENGDCVYLKYGDEIVLTTDYTVKGNENLIAVSYPKLAEHVQPGTSILAADGSITLSVVRTDPAAGQVICRCENNAKLGERKNMNLPGVVVDLPTITEKDQDDILNWGIKNEIDILAPSFVRKGSDVVHIRQVLGEAGKNIKIVSKVENNEGLDNFDAILAESDGIMVARGDLGMEIPMEKIFMVQKRMIEKCNLAGKPVVTATQMLESMTANPRPTRAEATDVANAVLDGTDCVMLSGETAAGPYPVESVKVMASVCAEAESYLDYPALFQSLMHKMPLPMHPLEALASSSVRAAQKTHASLIIVLSKSGLAARLVAKYRPYVPVLSVCIPASQDAEDIANAQHVARVSLLYRGLIPILAEFQDGPTKVKLYMNAAVKYALKTGLVSSGDQVVGIHKVEEDSIMRIISV